MVKIGRWTDEKIDALILIDGEKVEDELVWKGLTQTMKKVFVEELNVVKVQVNDVQKQLWKDNETMKDELSKVSTQVVSINRKVDLASGDTKK